jgi:hypothetical protein
MLKGILGIKGRAKGFIDEDFKFGLPKTFGKQKIREKLGNKYDGRIDFGL